jgi:hypothetical protein
MPRAEANYLTTREFDQVVASLEGQRGIPGAEDARYKTIAELSCLAYQLTKIPFIQKGGACFVAEAELMEVLAETALSSNVGDLVEICELRAHLYGEAERERLRTHGRESFFQDQAWVWNKVVGEEVGELAAETTHYLNCLVTLGEDGSVTAEGVAAIEVLAVKEERDLAVWLKEIFALAQRLGVRSELALFKFMAEKQRGRIALGKKHLTEEDKAEEWQRLIPAAQQYFN